MTYLYLFLNLLSLFLTKTLWDNIIDDFRLTKKSYNVILIITSILTSIYMIYFNQYNICTIALSVIAFVFCILSVIDTKYYEISGKSYYFLLFPILIYICFNEVYVWWECLISFVVLLFLFMILDKIIGVEKIGGADIKLMLLGSLMFAYYDLLIFICFIFGMDLILYFIILFAKLIKREKLLIKIPMIIAIGLGLITWTLLLRHQIYRL